VIVAMMMNFKRHGIRFMEFMVSLLVPLESKKLFVGIMALIIALLYQKLEENLFFFHRKDLFLKLLDRIKWSLNEKIANLMLENILSKFRIYTRLIVMDTRKVLRLKALLIKLWKTQAVISTGLTMLVVGQKLMTLANLMLT
jgi:hypothetical protein